MYKVQEVRRGRYDDRGYSNEESVANLMINAPVQFNDLMTYTYGMDDDRFPLTFLTEGQGAAGTQDIEKLEWKWPTMGRLKFDDSVLYFNTANTTPGKGGAVVEVEFKTHWLIEQYGLIAPDGRTQVRIMKDLGAGSHGGYRYLLKLTNPRPEAYIDPDNFKVGKYWSMTAPTVSQSYSTGNRSNSMGPGEFKNQLELHRFSKEIGGDVANTVVTFKFQNKNGGTTNLWMNEEMRQFDVSCRLMDEERLWFAEYNRDENGKITLIDETNGQPIPHTSGMIETCRESNYETYGEHLTLHKITRSIGDLLDKQTDNGAMNVVLACGKGFMEDFDDAIRRDAQGNGFATPLGDKMIGESADGLTYGKYFRQYKTIDGHTITLKHLAFLDRGTMADAARKNGLIHPRTGLPITSHRAYMLDFSMYGGKRNVIKVRKKGRVYKARVYAGMAEIPASWGYAPTSISTDVDMARYEIMNSYGLQVSNNSKMMEIDCVL